MKNKFKILYFFFGIAMLFTACTPKEYELGALMDKSALKFTVTQSSDNPNDVILESLTPNVTPSWVTPYGQSLRVKDTVNVPFPGTYKFVYGVESDGGFVQADTSVVIITTIDRNTVSEPLWVDLTGGYGNSKTWVLDIDANQKSKYFNGPAYFAGLNYSWEWDAGWASWIMPAADYGTMTFDILNDSLHFSSDNKTLPDLGKAKGTFMLYTSSMELSTFGAQLVHDGTSGARVVDWTAKALIKSLDANSMQIVEVIDSGTQWIIYNYISLDYYNSH
jgi:hypothetical protein